MDGRKQAGRKEGKHFGKDFFFVERERGQAIAVYVFFSSSFSLLPLCSFYREKDSWTSLVLKKAFKHLPTILIPSEVRSISRLQKAWKHTTLYRSLLEEGKEKTCGCI
jgi:hypothetical protein